MFKGTERGKERALRDEVREVKGTWEENSFYCKCDGRAYASTVACFVFGGGGGRVTATAVWRLHHRASRVDAGHWLRGYCCGHPQVRGEGPGLEWGWWEVLIAELEVIPCANVCGRPTQQSHLPRPPLLDGQGPDFIQLLTFPLAQGRKPFPRPRGACRAV